MTIPSPAVADRRDVPRCTDDLVDRRDRFTVPRRADGDYTGTSVCCPTHPDRRAYSVEPERLIAVGTQSIWVSCFWCDTSARVRMRDRDFDRDHPQPHNYQLVEVAHGE